MGRQGRRPTEGCFVYLGLKDSVSLLLKCLSHPPMSARLAGLFCFFHKAFKNCTLVDPSVPLLRK